MRIILFASMLGALAHGAEEFVTGDYVIPPQNQLRAGIPGEYRVLLRGQGLSHMGSNVFNSSLFATTDLTQITSGLNLANLRVRFLQGQSSGVDFPITALTANTLTLADVGPSSYYLFSAADNNGQPFELVELWTLNKLFPTDWPNGVTLYFNDISNGLNPSADRAYVMANGVWYQTLGGTGPKDDLVTSHSSFIIRNPGLTTIHWLFAAYSRTSPIRTFVIKTAPTGTAQDFWISDSSGTTHSLTSSPWGLLTGEQFLAFPVPASYTSSASYIALYHAPSLTWYWQLGNPTGSPSQYNLTPGEGFVLRFPAASLQDTPYVFNP